MSRALLLIALIHFPVAAGLAVEHSVPLPVEPDGSVPPPDLQRLPELLVQLADPDWNVRDRAQKTLREYGPDIIPRLARSFDDTDDQHTRLAIRSVVYSVFTRYEMSRRGAFLGVRQRLLSNSRIPEGRPGILIVQVLPDTSAARAGLQDGDIIQAINGNEMALPQQTREFADTIQRFPIGTEVHFEVLRGNRQLDLTVRLGERPFRYAEPLVRRRIQFAFSEMWTRRFAPDREEDLEYLGENR